jgi:FKBP-type peptidyl-prolyl cis-trans isomerase SlpA
MSDLIAKSSSPRIQAGSQVTLHFSLLIADGSEIDTTRNGKPATFTVGDGSLLPGFEAVLLNQQAGFADQVMLPAEEAFGEHREQNVQLIDRAKFAQLVQGEDLEPGLVVSFQAPDGELPGVVVAVYEQTVKVDFNHPLAGQSIVFDVSVLKVEAPCEG